MFIYQKPVQLLTHIKFLQAFIVGNNQQYVLLEKNSKNLEGKEVEWKKKKKKWWLIFNITVAQNSLKK